jgi:proteasome lid subunit RPN8/RPN11
MAPPVPPVSVSRLLLLALVAAGAVVSVAASPPLSSFAGGFAAGAGAVIVLSFLSHPRHDPSPSDEGKAS